MYPSIYRITWKTLGHRPRVVWILLWQLLFVVVAAAILLAFGLNQLSALLGKAPSPTVHSHNSIIPIMVLGIVLFPYYLAGYYGTVAEAIKDKPLTLGSFLGNGLRYFSRSYALILTTLGTLAVWVLVLGLAYFVLFSIVHLPLTTMIPILAVLGMIGAIPLGLWLLWFVNLLFVAGFKWPKALSRASTFARRYACLTAAIVITALIGQLLIVWGTLWLAQYTGMAGQILNYFILVLTGLFWSLSFMALYRVVTRKPEQDESAAS